MTALSERTAVIVDEHPLWLDALQALLERMDLRVVGRTTCKLTAEALIDEHRPDLLVADYSILEAEDGVPTIENPVLHARRVNSDARCVVLSDADDPRERERAFAAGATAFCVKRAEPDDVAAAIRQSFDHSIYFASTTPFAAAPPTIITRRDVDDEARSLTKREMEILRLAAEGHSNSQLARMLWVTEQTVKFHLSNIYRKLDVANRTEASRWAQRNGLLAAVEAA
jgi:DNA-binding NarL/FixJ family response regulator